MQMTPWYLLDIVLLLKFEMFKNKFIKTEKNIYLGW